MTYDEPVHHEPNEEEIMEAKAKEKMTEEQFHVARRMFAIRDKTLLVAPPNDPRTHIEWFTSVLGEFADAWMMCSTRGYIYQGRIVAYVGQDFNHHVNHEDLYTAILTLLPAFCFEKVGLGAQYDPNQQPWPVKVEYTVGEFMTRVARKIKGKEEECPKT